MKKKFLILFFAVISCIALVFGFAACGENGNGAGSNAGSGSDQTQTGGNEEHSHSYTQEISQTKYLKSEANCTQKAVYYKSCECGEKGEDTFEYGDFLHDYGTDNICKKCQIPWDYTEGLQYTINSEQDGYTVSALTMPLNDIVIPYFHEGLPVTSIGNYAFYVGGGTSVITSITIPNSVTSIGNSAFSSCVKLTSITIGNGVTSIGIGAFADCSELMSITIPDNVTSIGLNAFYNCERLTIYCEAESKPSDWDGEWNKSNCPVIWNCNRNDKDENGYVYVVESNVRYQLKDGIATVTRQPMALSGEITILSAITYKGNSYNVTNIVKEAFYWCSGLTSVTIPNSVTSIGDDAFYYCDELTSITIPNSVTSIGNRAFRNCYKLDAVTIGNSVTSIGYQVFYNCYRLTSITFQGTKKEWNEMEKSSSWNYNTGDYTVQCSDGKLNKAGEEIE